MDARGQACATNCIQRKKYANVTSSLFVDTWVTIVVLEKINKTFLGVNLFLPMFRIQKIFYCLVCPCVSKSREKHLQ